MATVSEGHKERDSIMRVNGSEAIELSLYKVGDANTVKVAENVRERLAEIPRSVTTRIRTGDDL